MARIFISYKRVDKDKVFRIKDKIEAALGEQCWIDLEGIESDAQFANIIINAINDAEIILFMYSNAHVQITNHTNDWTIRELNFANNRGKRIIFVNIDKAPLTDWFDLMFGTKQQVDATSKDAVDRLIRDLKKWLAIPVIHTKEQTEPRKKVQNFQRTKRYAHLLSKLKTHKKWLIGALCVMVAVVAIVGWVLTFPSPQESYAKGEEAYDVRYYAEAVKWYRKAAEQGHASAQNNLGYCYFCGEGVETDYAEAAKWFQKAAEQGNAAAQYNLGICYKHGFGVEEDNAEAEKWLKKSTEQGNAAVQDKVLLILPFVGEDVEAEDAL